MNPINYVDLSHYNEEVINMARRFKDFTRKMIGELAESYAKSSAECSRSYYCRNADITEATFYKILHTAIEQWIVDEETARMIARKSSLNAGKGSESEAGSIQSRRAYDESFKIRDSYEIPKSYAKKYAILYAYSSYNQRNFRNFERMPTKYFNKLIKKAIIECIISDEVVATLRKKSLENNNPELANQLFDSLEQEREEYKKCKKTGEQRISEAKEEAAKYVQRTMEDYGIPDEIEDYSTSLSQETKN